VIKMHFAGVSKTLLARAATASILVALLTAATPVLADPDAAVAQVRKDWEIITYRTAPSDRAARLEALAMQARQVAAEQPGSVDALIWEGIVVSSLAGAKGGFGALSLVKEARDLYEQAIRIDGKALDGSAYNSLGVLYYKVPGWPIGFGDKKKADALLKQALVINPDGIDPNFFYGDFLVQTGRAGEAVAYLERALKAPPRPGREIADEGRREEAQALLAKARSLI
jgi:tetratricopeptide (TPR) repeat protein